jgi:tetratricopeptide (TPR) repeat protein
MRETIPSSVSAVHRLQTWLLLALCGITLAVFAGVCGHEFVHYDDAGNIYRNPHLKGLGWEEIKWMFTDTSYARRYMPLGWMSYAVDYQLFGLNPRVYHIGNLLLHSVNVLLLFFLLKRLLILARPSSKPAESDPANVWCAALGALFWAVNPLRVENVAWASSRIYCVVFLFTMLWLLCWLRSRDAATPKAWRSIFYWLSVAAYAASLLTYPLAVFAPVALFALELFPLRRVGTRVSDWWQPGALKVWLDKVPFVVLSAGALVLIFSARMVSNDLYKPLTLEEFSLPSRIMQALYVWAYYAWKPWAPYDLSATYTTLHSFNPLDVKFLVSAGFVLAVTVALTLWRRRWPAALALWLCHLALLVPALGLTEYPHSTYDRYSYVQGAIWSIGIALLLRGLWVRTTHAYLAGIVVAATSMLFALLAWQQVPVWHDTFSLYQHMVAHIGEHPNRARFDEVLGVHYLRAGLTNEAVASFQRAIHYESRRADRHLYEEGVLRRAHLELADIFLHENRPEKALAECRAALESDPRSVTAVIKMAWCLSSLDRDAEAIACLREALRMQPENGQAHGALAIALRKTGKDEEARGHFDAERRLAEK